MTMKLKKCDKHNPSIYTFKDDCECGAKTHSAHPPKFSERYAKYRRMAKGKINTK